MIKINFNAVRTHQIKYELRLDLDCGRVQRPRQQRQRARLTIKKRLTLSPSLVKITSCENCSKFSRVGTDTQGATARAAPQIVIERASSMGKKTLSRAPREREKEIERADDGAARARSNDSDSRCSLCIRASSYAQSERVKKRLSFSRST